MFGQMVLIAKLVAFAATMGWEELCMNLTERIRRSQSKRIGQIGGDKQNIVVIGASFAGYRAARLMAALLPADSPYKVVVIEPHSHFHFTWVLPRFCVTGEPYKAFIPYGGFLAGSPPGRIQWIQGRVAKLHTDRVCLEKDGQEIPYEFLLIATGGATTTGLPSRVDSDQRESGLWQLEAMQEKIRGAKSIVVVGGGAAGYELATDAKHAYSDKDVTIVHSRDSVLNRFGPKLRQAAAATLNDLGVNVILEERLLTDEIIDGTIELSSGRKVLTDLVRANSSLLGTLALNAISASGHILTKPTLQVMDETLPNLFACGDVVATTATNTNSLSAMRQGSIAAKNIVSMATGTALSQIYEPHWSDGAIKLTLGLGKSVFYARHDDTELTFQFKEKDLTLNAAGAWEKLGVIPFTDSACDVRKTL